MSQPKTILAVVAALFVGATASHVTALLVPAAAAAPAAAGPAVPPKWEYFCRKHHVIFPDWNMSDGTNAANNLGRQGWELVTLSMTDNGVESYCFKRPYVDRPGSAPTSSAPPPSAPLPKGVAPRTDSDD